MATQGKHVKYIKYNGDKFIRKETMTKKQQIQHLYNIVRDLSKRIDSLQNKKATVLWAAELQKRIETLEQNQPKSNKSVSQTKGSEPDWENLLDIDDVKAVFGYYPLNSQEIAHFNQIIHERIQPLLDERNNYKEAYDTLITTNEALLRLTNVQNMHEGLIEVPFKLKSNNIIMFEIWGFTADSNSLQSKLRDMEIDQTRIKRILLEMKSEGEE